MSKPEGREWSNHVPKPKNKKTEVVALPQHDQRQRRRFTPDERERILREADACSERGQLGELLRREGIYSSQLSGWRAAREREGLAGLQNKRPGPKPTKDAKDRLIEQLEKRNAKLEKDLRISKALIELQEKAHEILGIALPRNEDAEGDSHSSSNSAPRRSR
jgi:transposase-like protein